MSEPESNVVARIGHILQHTNFLSEPAVPELSFRPDFMANMENNLTFFEIVSVKEDENVDWRTLRLIEHLFEVKLFFGNKSSFHLLALSREEWKPYCRELLESLFDRVTYGSDIQTFENLHTLPKQANFRLWDLEREFVRSRRFVFEAGSLYKFKYREVDAAELLNEISQKLLHFNKSVKRRHSVRNLKNYYLKRDLDLRFHFDFYVDRKIIEVKSFRRLRNAALQDLLIKSRLIRYEKRNDQIELAYPELERMILLVNGDISGPEYDKMRFLRMLTAAGWDVYPADISLRQLGRLI